MNSDELKKVVNAVPDSTKEELLNPTAHAIGEGIGTTFMAISHLVLDPLRKFNIARDQDLKDFANKTNAQLEKIPKENRDSSKASEFARELDIAKYSLDKEYMRDAFAKLIANTVDNRVNDKLYPSFPDILVSMSSDEARLLTKISKNFSSQVPTVIVSAKNADDSGERPVRPKVLLFDDSPVGDNSSTIVIDLLKRAGLINVIDDAWLTNSHYAEKYAIVENRIKDESTVNQYRNAGLIVSNESLIVNKGYISFTELGKEFTNLVL